MIFFKRFAMTIVSIIDKKSLFGSIPAAFFLIIFCLALPVNAQVKSWSIPLEDDSPVKYQPYIVLVGGFQDPVADSYEQVFSGPLVRYGGGFGLRINQLGFEVLLRDGTNRESHVLQGTNRNFELRATELQARIYGVPRYGKLSFPAGLGFGLVRLTVDRGYPGIWDRFNGDGFFISPFVSIEYRPVKSLSFGIDIEFPFSETQFSSNESWHNLYDGNLDGKFPTNNATETSFWDTVGGLNSAEYDNGGFVICLRVLFDLPTYKNPE